jgi:hypothetical protein
MTTTVRLRGSLSLATLLATTLSAASPAVAAGPYEIRAEWSQDESRLMPANVDFALDAIDYVPRLGVVAYGGHLLLRVEHDQPFVTLGIAAEYDTPKPVSYGSAAALPDGARLLTRTTTFDEDGVRVRRTVVVRLDADGRGEKPFAFPLPSKGKYWTSVRLLTNGDGQIFAYAGRARPRMVPINFSEVSPALDQRFYHYSDNGWQELPRLDPLTVTAKDACFVDGALFVVGGRIENDTNGQVVLRRGVIAKLDHGRWTAEELDSPADAEAFTLTGLRCGRARDRVFALASASVPGQSIGHTFLNGPPALYRFDGESWEPIPLPAGVAGDPVPIVSAFKVDRGGTLWVSFAGEAAGKSGTLYRYQDGSWSQALLPSVPEVSSYSLTGIAFDGDGHGWAVANREGNATVPESHGILLSYDGNDRNEWKLRGWKWSPLRQRWFGLFGNLR